MTKIYNFTKEELDNMKFKLEFSGNPKNLTPHEALKEMLETAERDLDYLEEIYIRKNILWRDK